MKILLHICCAPCLMYPYQTLSLGGENKVLGFFFNPNIHPYQEYRRRLETLQDWAKNQKFDIIYQDEYQLEDFIRGVVFRESERCLFCYYMRLNASVRTAINEKCDCFSSTLLYSKFQKHEVIKKIGCELEREYSLPFYYQDFREGWKEGISLSKKYGLYHQQYCGCIYSEKDRYWRAEIKKEDRIQG